MGWPFGEVAHWVGSNIIYFLLLALQTVYTKYGSIVACWYHLIPYFVVGTAPQIVL